MVAPDEAPGALMSIFWIALVVAVGIFALAALWIAARFVSTRLERRYLPDLARWSRRRAGMPEDAGPWACPACRSVNASTIGTCYRCGGSRAPGARELSQAATDPAVFHRPPPPNRFDPSLYRGPGVPAADPAGHGEPGAPAGEPGAPAGAAGLPPGGAVNSAIATADALTREDVP